MATRMAEYWRGVCLARSFQPIIEDRVARAILADAAERVENTGFRGSMWVFADGSMLIVTDNAETLA